MYEIDFRSRYLRMDTATSDSKIFIHYQTAKTAIAQVLDNILKYALTNSVIKVSFEKRLIDSIRYIAIVFDMTSLAIRKNEIKVLLQRGERSPFAKKLPHVNGEGQGLYIIQKMLALNDGFLEIDTDEKIFKHKGIPYTHNQFRLFFREAI